MNSDPSPFVLRDDVFNAAFHPTGYVVESAVDYADILRPLADKEARFSSDFGEWLDDSPERIHTSNAFLHELSHYFQYCTTSFGQLHLLLNMALVEVTLAYKRRPYLLPGLARPSSLFRYLREPIAVPTLEECREAAAAIAGILVGAPNLKPLRVQIEALQRALLPVVRGGTPEGDALMTFLDVDCTTEPDHFAVGNLVRLCSTSEVPLFGPDIEDAARNATLDTPPENDNEWFVSIRDIVEGHARLIEEFVILLSSHEYGRSTPWLTSPEYRASRQLAQYGVSRHMVSASLRKTSWMRELIELTSGGRKLDWTDEAVRSRYTNFLLHQLMIHELALMVPLEARGKAVAWDVWAPTERFSYLVGLLSETSFPEMDLPRMARSWVPIADRILRLAAIEAPGKASDAFGSLSHTRQGVRDLAHGELGRLLPALRSPWLEIERYGFQESVIYGAMAAVVPRAVETGPGPFFFSAGRRITNEWFRDPASIPQWQIWMWSLLAQSILSGSNRLLRFAMEACGGDPGREAAERVGLLVSDGQRPLEDWRAPRGARR